MISGAPEEVVRRLQSYGSKIGTAYQIYDDCLDIAGTEIETGKTLGTDLRKGKLTLPVLIMSVCVVVTWVLIRHTTTGRQLYAFGDNPEGAKRLGINID